MGLFLGILAYLYQLIYFDQSSFQFIYSSNSNMAGVAIILLIIFPEIIFNIIPINKSKEKKVLQRFAYGAISCSDEDAFGYSVVAKREASRLIEGLPNDNDTCKDIDSVVVKSIVGDQGWGKSSFQRMIIESIPQEEILYSYISLTEVNDEKDFGVLFADRWKQSLLEKYPDTLSDCALSSSLKEIIRPQNEIFSAIIEFIPAIVESLMLWYEKTPLKVFPKSSQKNDSSDKDISRAFHFLSSVKERAWIIVIDEIERAPLSEIYRVIEIIERFKSMGRNGMPLQIIFLCVFDEKILHNRTDDTGNHKELIENFFFSSGVKTINSKIHLPPISISIRSKWVREKAGVILEKYDFSGWGNEQKSILGQVSDIPPYLSLDGGVAYGEKERLGFIIFSLANKSPRVIDKVFYCVDNVLSSFQRIDSSYNAPFFTLADVIMMEYGKLEFPEFLEYMNKLIPNITEPHWQFKSQVLSYDFRRSNPTIKKSISYIVGISESEISDNLCYLIDMLCPSHRRVFRGDSSFEYEIEQMKSLSWPRNMLKYLRLDWEDNLDKYLKSANYLKEFTENKLDCKDIPPSDFANFMSFASFTREEVNIDKYKIMINEAIRRINEGEFPIDLNEYDQSSREEIIVSILRIFSKLSEMITLGGDKHNRSFNIQIFADIFENLIQAKLSVGEIYRITNWVLVEKGGDSNYYREIIAEWPGGSDKFKKIISSKISECINKYVTDIKDIYTEEPLCLVQFVLYQSWSKANDLEEISRIRNIASRTLYLHKEALKYYWNPFLSLYNHKWKSFEDIPGHFWESVASVVYLPIDLLIEATERSKNISEEISNQIEFWKAISKDENYQEFISKKIIQLSGSENTDHTIHSYLLSKGYLSEHTINNIIVDEYIRAELEKSAIIYRNEFEQYRLKYLKSGNDTELILAFILLQIYIECFLHQNMRKIISLEFKSLRESIFNNWINQEKRYIPQKLNSFTSLFFDVVPDNIQESVDIMKDRFEKMSSIRNLLIHGYAISAWSDSEGKSGLSHTKSFLTKNQLDKSIVEVNELGDSWNKLLDIILPKCQDLNRIDQFKFTNISKDKE